MMILALLMFAYLLLVFAGTLALLAGLGSLCDRYRRR